MLVFGRLDTAVFNFNETIVLDEEAADRRGGDRRLLGFRVVPRVRDVITWVIRSVELQHGLTWLAHLLVTERDLMGELVVVVMACVGFSFQECLLLLN